MGDDYMLFNIGDYVTRFSHNHDMVFKIKKIVDDIAILEGINVRLIADAPLDDLNKCEEKIDDITKEDRTLYEKMQDSVDLNRDQYFYLPGKVLHIDSDKDYLNRCIKFYKDMNIVSYGVVCLEEKIHVEIRKHLEKIRPDVLVITGHDAYYERDTDDYTEISNYKNSKNFVKAVKAARDYEKDHEKLIIIAGACQSNYEELIKAGAHIVTDTNMALAGINKKKLASFGGQVHCFMADEDVAKEAKQRQVTRATVSMERAAALPMPVIFAIGNAPTALISLYEMMEQGRFTPEFVIGVPVGFVNVEAAKELFINSDVPYIINKGRKGGSNIAAAIVNAILYSI